MTHSLFIIKICILIFELIDRNINAYSIGKRVVVTGETSKTGQFPYQVMLIGSISGGRILCGGSLLDTDWILTAGHCIDGASEFEIHLGAQSLTNYEEKDRIILKSSKYILHEKYNPYTAANDIGLIKLPQKIKFSEKIKPIKLAVKNDDFAGRKVIATGWGLLSSKSLNAAPQLQFAELEVITNKECTKDFNPIIIQDGTLCAKGNNRQSVCSGDSGGPLVLRDERTLIGVTSFGHVIGCDYGYPGGFSRISHYVDWITSKTGIKP